MVVRQIIEEIEELHSANSLKCEGQEPRLRQSQRVEATLADCLQELRAIVAAEALDQICGRPLLRIV
jgi:hypothetical protein